MSQTPAVAAGVAAAMLALGSAVLPANEIRSATTEPPGRVVVVVELFTSEGCSSCPAADELLARLITDQPIAGVEIIGLSEHVDYWDHLGWRDPFSSASFSNRQSQYDAQVFRSDRIYTPQVVIDGQAECVGSDLSAITREATAAAKRPKATVAIAARVEGKHLRVDIQVDAPADRPLRERSDVVVAVTEDQLSTKVRRGENGGRVLRHSAVTRSLGAVGQLSLRNSPTSTTATVLLSDQWQREHLRIVAFVQERQSRRIVGAASVALVPNTIAR